MAPNMQSTTSSAAASPAGGITRPALLLVLFLALLAAGGCAAASGGNATDVPPGATSDDPDARVIRFIIPHDLPLARTHVNGRHVGMFLLDTGSSITVVEKNVARRLGLQPVATGRVTGIGGTEQVDIAYIDSLRVDNFHVGRHRVAMVDLDALQSSARTPIAGILGINTLRPQPFTIDYTARRILLHDPDEFEPPEDAVAVRLHEINRLPAIEAQVVRDDRRQSIWLLLDSGMNSHLALPYAAVRENLWMLTGNQNIHRQAVGVGGAARNITSQVPLLRGLGREWQDVPVQLELDAPDQRVRGRPVGRIGNGLLTQLRLTFDYADRTVWIEPANAPRLTPAPAGAAR